MDWLRRLSNPLATTQEPWDVARERLLALVEAPDDPSPQAVASALEPLGLGDALVSHEAMRVLSLLGHRGSATTLLRASALPRSVPTLYDARSLITAVRRQRAEKAGAGRTRAALKRRLAVLSEDDRRSLDYARSRERELVERARAFEALAKEGHSPAWVARSWRVQAQQATREREVLEQRLAGVL